MTFISNLNSNPNNLAVNFKSITLLHNTANNIACNVGTVLPLGKQTFLHGSDTYSVSNGVITLPSGYYYLIRGGLGAGISTSYSTFAGLYVKYQFYDTNNSTHIGRRGTLTWQENPLLEGGDDYAIAVVDASSVSQNVDLRVVKKNGTGMTIDNTTYQYYTYAGHSRVEIWKWN